MRGDDVVPLLPELAILALQKRFEIFAADFFLTFGEDDHVHGQRAADGQMRFERLDVEIQLPFVVD